jgi:hypothetical protein
MSFLTSSIVTSARPRYRKQCNENEFRRVRGRSRTGLLRSEGAPTWTAGQNQNRSSQERKTDGFALPSHDWCFFWQALLTRLCEVLLSAGSCGLR